MTREEKRKLAAIVINRCADIVEFWDEIAKDELPNVSVEEASELIAGWLLRTPGDYWDTRLPAKGLRVESEMG